MALRIYVDFTASSAAMELLRAGTAGHELVFPEQPAPSVLVQAPTSPQFATVDIAFGQPDPQAVAQASRLRWIQVSSSSITRYDTADFRKLVTARGIAVSNSAHVYAEACADHTLAFMLAQSRNLPWALRSQAPSGTPEYNTIRHTSIPLRGQSVLIAGYGAIGQRLVELLQPFAMRIAAYRRKPRGDEGVPVIGPGDFARGLADADHVVNILPDSGETRRFFDAARFSAMKPGAVFYNIGRGTTVDQDALRDALRSGQLKAAWLDVTDPEPLPADHPLRKEPNCHITPHVAGGHFEETMTLVRHFLANLERFQSGQPLIDRVM